jgi:hypothetical protein
MSAICRITLPAPAQDRGEVLRYLKCAHPSPEVESMLAEVERELLPLLEYKVCYALFPLKREGTGLHFGNLSTDSRDLAKALSGCEEILLFAATVGLAPDRLTTRYGHISPAKALCVQAIGAERIEALCDAFVRYANAHILASGSVLRPRFSPGYGDLPLTLQQALFAALDCPRQIGLCLNESLLMSPTKSVTALAGIQKNEA